MSQSRKQFAAHRHHALVPQVLQREVHQIEIDPLQQQDGSMRQHAALGRGLFPRDRRLLKRALRVKATDRLHLPDIGKAGLFRGISKAGRSRRLCKTCLFHSAGWPNLCKNNK